MKRVLCLAALGAVAATGSSQMRITEWMYNGADGEYIEFTNLGGSSIDMAGWSFDDSSRLSGSVDLSGFGIVGGGQSVVLTEVDAALFAANWGGLAGVAVIGGNNNNLGRADEINLFDAGGNLVDRLTYDDQNGLGPRTLDIGGNVPLANLGQNSAPSVELSFVGDAYGSWVAANGGIGNPGQYAPVPEPVSLAALALGGACLARRRRSRARTA